MDNLAQQGWQCPICKRVYSPFTMMCYYCGGDTIISTGVSGTGIDRQMTCDNCKHNGGLPHNNGTMEYSGACKRCVAKDMWEEQNNG